MTMVRISIKGICKTYGVGFRKVLVALKELDMEPDLRVKSGNHLFSPEKIQKIIKHIRTSSK